MQTLSAVPTSERETNAEFSGEWAAVNAYFISIHTTRPIIVADINSGEHTIRVIFATIFSMGDVCL